MDVRAANDVVVSYDFDRDGWVISMPEIEEWNQLQEVAFVPAWATGEPD